MVDLCLLGTWKGVEDDAGRVRRIIQEKGAWASWWSFPLREDFQAQAKTPFFLYINAGEGRIPFRMRVEEYRTSRGNEGIVTPWHDITDPESTGKTKLSDKTSEIFKTWVRVTSLEKLIPPLRQDDFEPALGTKREALLNQAAFGYASAKDSVPDTQISPSLSIRASLENIMSRYSLARQELFKGHAILGAFLHLKRALEHVKGVRDNPRLRIKVSRGKGNWVAVPWAAILDSRETDSAQVGVYVVLLFREDMSGAYLTLNQGVTNLKNDMGRTKARQRLRERARELQKFCSELPRQGFSLEGAIDLHTSASLGKDYENGTVASKFYSRQSVPSDEELNADISAVLKAYQTYMSDKATTVNDASRSLGEVVDSFAQALRKAHIAFGPTHDGLVRSFIASLATKRFAILTGLSGSGKTQIALRFGQWLGKSAVVAVRPDWTGAESLFGYEDALQEAKGGRRPWHVPKALKLMLSAAANPSQPHLLVLDEMNLAHVERYFADILSGMESGEVCLPNLSEGSDGLWRLRDGGPEEIKVPSNLFVVGTVNVDETTYLFSPKVLDRANTFEFRVNVEDLSTQTQKPEEMDPGPFEIIQAFMSVAINDRWHLDHPAQELPEFDALLRTLHRLLSEGGFEFGHRVFYEAIRYSAMLSASGDSGHRGALDNVILQKILPRLHGARRRLEAPLCSLGRFCMDLTHVEGTGIPGSVPQFNPSKPPASAPLLPKSFDKVRRMYQSLVANQFASFTE